jgi:hypothetical protein
VKCEGCIASQRITQELLVAFRTKIVAAAVCRKFGVCYQRRSVGSLEHLMEFGQRIDVGVLRDRFGRFAHTMHFNLNDVTVLVRSVEQRFASVACVMDHDQPQQEKV